MVSRFIINFLETEEFARSSVRRERFGWEISSCLEEDKFYCIVVITWLESYVFLLFEKCKVPDTRLALHNCRREIYNTAAV